MRGLITFKWFRRGLAAAGEDSRLRRLLAHLLQVEKGKMDEEGAQESLREGERWFTRPPRFTPEKLLKLFKLFLRVLRDYYTGAFKELPFNTIATLAVGILYVINPFDLIPDFIPGVGFVDDLAMLYLVLSAVHKDLLDYCAWKGLDPEAHGLKPPGER